MSTSEAKPKSPTGPKPTTPAKTTDGKRRVDRVIQALEQSEGVGARVKRTIGIPGHRDVDPLIMLDEFYVTKGKGGFPDHPHRGFSTLTYMLEGSFRHKDNKGHEGVIEPHGVQFMRAGSGLVHSEMPETAPPAVNRGLQLWINLKKVNRMKPPLYQELNNLPMASKDGVTARAVVGEDTTFKLKSSFTSDTPFAFLYYTMTKDSNHVNTLAESHNGFIYVTKGRVAVNDSVGKASQLMRFDEGGEGAGSVLEITALEDSEFALITGEPIKEPMYQMGPIVMNTREEVFQAFADYQAGKF